MKKARKTEQTRHQERFLVSIRRVIRFERRRLLFTGTRVNSPRILIHEKLRARLYTTVCLVININTSRRLLGKEGRDRNVREGWKKGERRRTRELTKTERVRSSLTKDGKRGLRSIHLIILLPCSLPSHPCIERIFAAASQNRM